MKDLGILMDDNTYNSLSKDKFKTIVFEDQRNSSFLLSRDFKSSTKYLKDALLIMIDEDGDFVFENDEKEKYVYENIQAFFKTYRPRLIEVPQIVYSCQLSEEDDENDLMMD